MSEQEQQSTGGTYGSLPSIEIECVYVAPATKNEKNTIRLPLIPIACWRLDDVRFEFDSSIVKPETRQEMKDLAVLREMNPGAAISIFGHADPTGDEVYNKQLSGRRAAAIYGVVTRDLDLWEKLYSQSFGGDVWKTRSLQIMLTALGFDTQGADGVHGANTTQAIKNFQSAKGAQPNGADNAATRKLVFAAYMDFLCVTAAGAPYQIAKSEFLSRNEDPNGKGDYQGCSEFNPVLIFSIALTEELKRPGMKVVRDSRNAPNRRVTAMLFRPGSYVPPSRWPCPAAKDGIAGCKARFWSDSKRRLAPAEEDRHFEKTHDTFACRFYDRLTTGSPCEETVKYWVIRVMETGYKPINERKPVANVSFKLTGADGGPPIVNGTTDADGVLRVLATSNKAQFLLKIAGVEIRVNAGELKPSGADADADRQRLCNLGYGPSDPTKWSLEQTDAAYRKFQREHFITETGASNPATIAKLKEMHGG